VFPASHSHGHNDNHTDGTGRGHAVGGQLRIAIGGFSAAPMRGARPEKRAVSWGKQERRSTQSAAMLMSRQGLLEGALGPIHGRVRRQRVRQCTHVCICIPAVLYGPTSSSEQGGPTTLATDQRMRGGEHPTASGQTPARRLLHPGKARVDWLISKGQRWCA